ncbi:hypothetical protein LK537_27265 [Lachnoclostridium pacaense]|uniref:hypothetical protein n=1 Tax=Enterocloster hominis (ex Hitch et al. 2024) TaxID=1917870 RepID=UPI001D11247C|nr:hypothetical protein [Lachnoclostridium pacaense]MCC2820999.1 hypothetical protein [Lachnoclostridium pacaense]
MKYGKLYKILILMAAALVVVSLGIRLFKKQPSMEQPSMERPSVEQPIMERPSVEQSSMEQSSMEQPIMEQSSQASVSYPAETGAPDEEIEPEQYAPWEGTVNRVYFVNTENTIDRGDVLPVNAQGRLVEAAQAYIDEVGIDAQELYCIDDSVITEGGETSFQVRCDDGGIIITMTYNRDMHTWSFEKE